MPRPTSAPPASQRMPRAERRAQLVRAAAAAFLVKGYGATSVEEVAERAGVTRLIVYRHFGGKEELYRAVLASVTGQFRARVGDAHPGHIVATMVAVGREHPDAFRLLWRHARHEPLFAAEAATFRLVAATYADSVVGRYVDDPTFRRWAASAVVEHLHEGICTWLDTGDPDRDGEFAARLRDGTRALVAAWSG